MTRAFVAPEDDLARTLDYFISQSDIGRTVRRPVHGYAPIVGNDAARPDPEVCGKKPRRHFTAAYKLRILKEFDACTHPEEKGALLRREGLYHSNICTWGRQREKGELHGLAPKKQGRRAKEVNPLAKRVAQLEWENRRLNEKLRKAETIIEVQKKISEILGIPQPEGVEKS
jgi:transposase